jgi:hypothetical protein
MVFPLKKRSMHPNDQVEAEPPPVVFHSPIKVKPPVGGEADQALNFRLRVRYETPLPGSPTVSCGTTQIQPKRSLSIMELVLEVTRGLTPPPQSAEP